MKKWLLIFAICSCKSTQKRLQDSRLKMFQEIKRVKESVAYFDGLKLMDTLCERLKDYDFKISDALSKDISMSKLRPNADLNYNEKELRSYLTLTSKHKKELNEIRQKLNYMIKFLNVDKIGLSDEEKKDIVISECKLADTFESIKNDVIDYILKIIFYERYEGPLISENQDSKTSSEDLTKSEDVLVNIENKALETVTVFELLRLLDFIQHNKDEKDLIKFIREYNKNIVNITKELDQELANLTKELSKDATDLFTKYDIKSGTIPTSVFDKLVLQNRIKVEGKIKKLQSKSKYHQIVLKDISLLFSLGALVAPKILTSEIKKNKINIASNFGKHFPMIKKATFYGL